MPHPPRIHGIFSSYFGDDEFDVGKAIRWNRSFCDTEYILDLGSADRARAYVIDWVRTFPDVSAGYYQDDPEFFDPGGAENWRRTSFEQADAKWAYQNDDWIVFVDCTECLSCDESIDHSSEVDPSPEGNFFQPWLRAEIETAVGSQISLPVYPFVGNSPVWPEYVVLDEALQEIIDSMSSTDIYLGLNRVELSAANISVTQQCYTDVTLAGWSPRIFSVAALRDPDFDWSILDTFVEAKPSDAAQTGMAIVSYAYARWASDPSRIDRSVQRPMTELDDDGWRMRKKMSRVRPVPGLDYVDWSVEDSGQICTYPRSGPPLSVEPMDRQFSSDFNHSFSNFDAVVPAAGDEWDSDWDSLQFLYPTIIRMNRREGLFFLEDEHGPTPWNFYTGQPSLTPEQIAVREALTTEIQSMPRTNLPRYVPPRPPSDTPLYPTDTIRPVEEIPTP